MIQRINFNDTSSIKININVRLALVCINKHCIEMKNIISQSLEVLGYSCQYLSLRANSVISQYSLYARFAIEYCRIYMFDQIDYYYRYLILSFPKYMFGTPVLNIQQYDDVETDSEEDSDYEPPLRHYDVFVSQLEFIYKTSDIPPIMTSRAMSGAQLRPFIDDKGRFFIGHIQQYYPNLDTILIKYIKKSSDGVFVEEESSNIKVIDVAKRYDVRNNRSHKFGVYL